MQCRYHRQHIGTGEVSQGREGVAPKNMNGERAQAVTRFILPHLNMLTLETSIRR